MSTTDTGLCVGAPSSFTSGMTGYGKYCCSCPSGYYSDVPNSTYFTYTTSNGCYKVTGCKSGYSSTGTGAGATWHGTTCKKTENYILHFEIIGGKYTYSSGTVYNIRHTLKKQDGTILNGVRISSPTAITLNLPTSDYSSGSLSYNLSDTSLKRYKLTSNVYNDINGINSIGINGTSCSMGTNCSFSNNTVTLSDGTTKTLLAKYTFYPATANSITITTTTTHDSSTKAWIVGFKVHSYVGPALSHQITTADDAGAIWYDDNHQLYPTSNSFFNLDSVIDFKENVFIGDSNSNTQNVVYYTAGGCYGDSWACNGCSGTEYCINRNIQRANNAMAALLKNALGSYMNVTIN